VLSMDITIWVLLLIIALVVGSGIRVAAESERFVVTALGRFLKLVGPGLLFRLPLSPQVWTRLKLGDTGRYAGDGIGEFKGISVPIQVTDSSENDPVQIVSFRDGKVWASRSAERTITCEKCGHEMRISA
jgi:regulator of protease activity HflC (stomatin/prohibitin superfamily)